MFWRFQDRREAGQHLAKMLGKYANRDDTVVLALPRGGVPVAFEVARELSLPLDVFIVRKLGVPGQEELAFGAIASGGIRVLNESLIRGLNIAPQLIEKIVKDEQMELERREGRYRGGGEVTDLKGKRVIIVDDGLATGASMIAAVRAIRSKNPLEIIVAVPISPADVCDQLNKEADVVCVCAMTPQPFHGVGMWYLDFSQTSDEEVIDLLSRAENTIGAPA